MLTVAKDPSLIGRLRKNSTEELWVRLRELSGKLYLDVRVFVAVDGKASATTKGICLPLDRVPQLIELLNRANPLWRSEIRAARGEEHPGFHGISTKLPRKK